MSSAFFFEANKLKHAEISIRKNESYLKLLEKYDVEPDNCESLPHEENERIVTELKTIFKTLHAKKAFLKHQNVNNLDLKTFKNDMIQLQEKIQQLKIKLKHQKETLDNQEKNALEQVEPYNKKLGEWERPIKYFSSYHHKLNNNSSNVENLDKDVKEFIDFVNKSNGHENGWASEDHQLFLKYRKKTKDMNMMAEKLQKLMPDMTTEDIIKHEAWYKHYSELKSKHIEALKRWKLSKTITEEKENCTEATPPPKPLLKLPTRTIEELAKWKAEKQYRKDQIRFAELLRREEMRKIDDEKRKRLEKIKESVKKWREHKLAEEHLAKMQKEVVEYNEKKVKAHVANKLIKQFQSQDDIFVMRNRLRRSETNKQAVRRSRSSTISNRDPDRLFKPTKQWILRTSKDEHAEKEAVPIPNIRVIQKLRIPEWRKQKI